MIENNVRLFKQKSVNWGVSGLKEQRSRWGILNGREE